MPNVQVAVLGHKEAGRMLTLFDRVVDQVPQLHRGRVWCRTCGHTQRVDAAQCLRGGWPACCGATMTIDSPDEQRVYTPTEEK